MITIPVYDLLILPEVTFYFKKDMLLDTEITAEDKGQDILFVMQKSDKSREDLTQEDFYPLGVVGKIETVTEDGNVRIRTAKRVIVNDIDLSNERIHASAVSCEEEEDISEEEKKKLFDNMKNEMLQFVRNFQWGAWARGFILHWKTMEEASCSLASYFDITWEEKYGLLEMNSMKARYEKISDLLRELIEVFRVRSEAEQMQQQEHDKSYREVALKKQMEYLQEQLDDLHPENITDVRMFEKKLAQEKMNEEAKKECEKVLNRMKQEGPNSHEYGIFYDYLDFMTTLSWESEEMPEIDLQKAEEILDEDHYGLKKVKERIIEQLAVMALNKKQSGSILLFVGAPGTGKTSIGQSIAKALGRKYTRISLGGIRDEAEIRGHRRTYVGAMPGRIMEGMKRSGAKNPVMVLDEVDKLMRDHAGDPASALLEVLDPEQNHTFTDHYMNAPYDLSDVFFVCTANSTDTIPEPLLNRMEVISFPGYTPVEKFQIAKRHLLPRAMKGMGIKAQNLRVSDEAIRQIIEGYTAEAGVRGLKKQMDILCRHAAVKLVRGEQKSFTVSEKRVREFMGRKPINREKVQESTRPGIVTGLAWTMAGGEILFIETAFMKGEGKIIITGQLGDVMKESAQIAISLVKMMYPEHAKKFEENNLHIHVPAGAVPKDGPSAGITLVTAVSSLVTGKAVSPEIGMTGEVSLRGNIMPIGGLPEKLMAAQRAGVKKVFIPVENRDDLEDVAKEVKEKLEIVPVKRIEELLESVGLMEPKKC